MEIALIKLCRPAMETNLDSVLDRIRVLEQKIEERPGTAGSRTECGSTGKRSNSCAGRTAEAATEGCSGRPAEDSGKLEDDRWTDYSSFQTGVASVCAEIQWRDW